jgi:hypothetical protein
MGEIGSAVGLEELSWPLLTLGLLMIGLGVIAPGTQPKAVTALILAGSSLSAIAVLHPIYREFEIGLTKLRFARRDTGAPAPWMVAEAETLTGIARWALGDSDLARTIVEDALTMVRRVNRRIPPDEREVTKLKTLVALLYKADQRRMLADDGRAGSAAITNGTMAALQAVDFEARIAFALCSEFRVKEVAEVLDSSEEEVSVQIQRARDVVRLNAPTDGSPE